MLKKPRWEVFPTRGQYRIVSPVYVVKTEFRIPTPNCTTPRGVPLVPTSPRQTSLADDAHAPTPSSDVSNVEFQ